MSPQYRICSNTKLFTAVAISQLFRLGKIQSLTDNIALYLDARDLELWGYPPGSTKYCPKLRGSANCQTVTFLSLLTMSSGIVPGITCGFPPGDWRLEYCISASRITRYMGSIAQTISLFAQNNLAFAPGPTYGPAVNNTYEYANENFIILSYFIEKLSGLSLQSYFRSKIFEPLGMSSTVFDPFGQAFQVVPNSVGEYYYLTDLSAGTQPIAIGSCANTGQL